MHFAFSVFLFFLEASNEFRTITGDKLAHAIFAISSPFTFISVSFSVEMLALTMSFAMEPLADVETTIVVETAALAFSQVIAPLPVILIVASFFLVGAEVDAVAVALVVADLAFVAVSVVVVEDGGSVLATLVLKLTPIHLTLLIHISSRFSTLWLPLLLLLLLLRLRPLHVILHHESFPAHVVLLLAHTQVAHFYNK